MKKMKQYWENLKSFQWTKENITKISKIYVRKTLRFIKKYSNINTWKDSMIPENPEYNTRIKRFFVMFLTATLSIVFIIIFIFLAIGQISTPRVRMPSLIQMDVIDAVRLAQAEKLTVNFETRFNEDTERFTVIGQFPPAGLNIKQGRKITIIVSMGQDLYTVPDLDGLNRKDATALLTQKNIPYEIIEVPAGENATDVVIGQSIAAKAKIPRNQNLIVTITKNIREGQYKIDDFTRQSLEFASVRLFNNGITPIVESTNVASVADDGMIFAQSVLPDAILPRNSSITLLVGVYGRDQGERTKLSWRVLRYQIPSIKSSSQVIFTNTFGEEQITNTGTAANAKYYRIEVEDELGRKSTLYERTGGEGNIVVRAFKSYGKSMVTMSADYIVLETKHYE